MTQLFAAEVCLPPQSWSAMTCEHKDSGSSVRQRYDLDTDSVRSHELPGHRELQVGDRDTPELTFLRGWLSN